MAVTTLITAVVVEILTASCFLLPAKNTCAGFGALCLKRDLVLKSERPFSCSAFYNPQAIAKEQGRPETLDYRVFFHGESGKKLKFLKSLKQDMKNGKIRFHPYNINWNYGLLPQTWEDPSQANSEVEGAFGDNDPVDVVEIGETQRKIGEILKIKPLAALAMIDEGELDWKIVAISLDDPKAHLVNDIDDVEKHFPACFLLANKFGLGDKPANNEYALKIIHETNEAWTKLVTRSVDPGDLSLF